MSKLLVLSFLISFNTYAYFNMHQPIINNNYKVCIIGDTGTGTSTQKIMGEMLAKEGCHQIRLLGDVVYPSGLKNEFDTQFFDKFYVPFKSTINSLNKPIFHIVTGNHDYKQDEYVWTKLHNKYHYLFSPSLNYVETYHQGKVCFFNFDTTAAENFYVRRAYKTFKWLRAQVKGHSRCKVKLAFAHHPYKSSGHHGNASTLTKYFLKYSIIGKVDAFFAGHEHQLSHEGNVQGTELFISGSFAKTRPLERKPRFGTSKNGYLVMNIEENSDKLNVNLHFKVLDKTEMKSVYQYQISK